MEIQVKSHSKNFNLKITANNNTIPENGILTYRNKKWDRDYADTFIQHAFCCLNTENSVSRIIDLTEQVTFKTLTITEAGDYLKNLANIYVEGILHPLPFFLKSALEFSSRIIKPKAEIDKIFSQTASKYNSSYQDTPGDYNCEYTSYLFGPDLHEYRNKFISLTKIITEPVFLNSEGNNEK